MGAKGNHMLRRFGWRKKCQVWSTISKGKITLKILRC